MAVLYPSFGKPAAKVVQKGRKAEADPAAEEDPAEPCAKKKPVQPSGVNAMLLMVANKLCPRIDGELVLRTEYAEKFQVCAACRKCFIWCLLH